MSEGFQYGDIIFLAIVAVFVLLRLRSTLGKDSGIDPRELWKNASRETVETEKTVTFPERPKKITQDDVVPVRLQANQAVSDGLKAIRQADSQFSTTDFLTGARMAFEWVVEAFSKGDKDKLKMLLSDERYQHFAADIDARAGSGTTQETTIVSVLDTDITEAILQGGKAQITVQFTSEQIHVERDKDGTIIGGDPSHIEKVIDVWTFERPVNSRDPNWKIAAT